MRPNHIQLTGSTLRNRSAETWPSKESQGNGLTVYSACFSLIADEHGLCPHQPLWNQGSHELLKVTLQLHMDVNLGEG